MTNGCHTGQHRHRTFNLCRKYNETTLLQRKASWEVLSHIRLTFRNNARYAWANSKSRFWSNIIPIIFKKLCMTSTDPPHSGDKLRSSVSIPDGPNSFRRLRAAASVLSFKKNPVITYISSLRKLVFPFHVLSNIYINCTGNSFCGLMFFC